MRSWFSTSTVAVPLCALMLAMVSIQAGASVAKQLFPIVGAQGTALLRLGLSLPMLGVVWRPWRARLTAATAWPLLAYGGALGAMNLLFYMALRSAPLGVAVALEFTGPLAIAVWRSHRMADLAWIALAIAGLLLLIRFDGPASRIEPAGIACALGAGFFWAVYIVFGQRVGALHGGRAVALGTIVAAAVVAPFGVAEGGWRLLDPAILPVALLVALTTSAAPNALEMVALTRLTQRTFGMLMSLEPAVGSIAGLLLLGERLTGTQLVAIAAIIVACAGTMATSRRRTREGAMPLSASSLPWQPRGRASAGTDGR